MSRGQTSVRVEIKSWTKRHRCPDHADYECEECREPITFGRYIRKVLRVHAKRGTREYTFLEVVREHDCCPDWRLS